MAHDVPESGNTGDGAEAPAIVAVPPSQTPAINRLPFDPNRVMGEMAPYLRAAACGELEAQRALRQVCFSSIAKDRPALDVAGLTNVAAVEGIHYSRLCAAHGDPDDAWCLVGALYFASDLARGTDAAVLADYWTVEVLTILEGLAETGDERAAVVANDVVAGHPRAIEHLRHLTAEGLI